MPPVRGHPPHRYHDDTVRRSVLPVEGHKKGRRAASPAPQGPLGVPVPTRRCSSRARLCAAGWTPMRLRIPSRPHSWLPRGPAVAELRAKVRSAQWARLFRRARPRRRPMPKRQRRGPHRLSGRPTAPLWFTDVIADIGRRPILHRQVAAVPVVGYHRRRHRVREDHLLHGRQQGRRVGRTTRYGVTASTTSIP